MSAALWERAGIPQVARQTVWLLSRWPEVSTSALFLSIHDHSAADRYSKKRKPPLSHKDEAEYLADVLGNIKKPESEALYEVGRAFRRAFTGANPLLSIQSGLFTDVIWENYFAPSLPPYCREFLSKIGLFRSPLMRNESLARLRWGLPLSRLNTADVDFIIFQNPTPIRVSSKTIKIIRLHDLVPLLRFDTQPQIAHIMQDFYDSLSHCVKDSYFACVSESTRRELVALFPQAEPKAFVVPNSVSLPVVQIQTPSGERQKPYFLAVGTIEPRKNYRRLIEAFRTYRANENAPHRLIIVGHSGWHNGEVLADIKKAKKEGWLTWFKQVSPDELTDLYRHAYAFISPSVHEGFGLPPLEAAMFGTPSALSSLPVFRAHFGDAAEYFDPYDPTSITEGLLRMTTIRRAELTEKVQEIARSFQTANELKDWQKLFAVLSSDTGALGAGN